jgi:hypothetical protein
MDVPRGALTDLMLFISSQRVQRNNVDDTNHGSTEDTEITEKNINIPCIQ